MPEPFVLQQWVSDRSAMPNCALLCGGGRAEGVMRRAVTRTTLAFHKENETILSLKPRGEVLALHQSILANRAFEASVGVLKRIFAPGDAWLWLK